MYTYYGVTLIPHSGTASLYGNLSILDRAPVLHYTKDSIVNYYIPDHEANITFICHITLACFPFTFTSFPILTFHMVHSGLCFYTHFSVIQILDSRGEGAH